MIHYSTPENPAHWCEWPGQGVIEFFSSADAKRAEALFNKLSSERDMLLTGLIAAVQAMEEVATNAMARQKALPEKLMHHDIPAARAILERIRS